MIYHRTGKFPGLQIIDGIFFIVLSQKYHQIFCLAVLKRDFETSQQCIDFWQVRCCSASHCTCCEILFPATYSILNTHIQLPASTHHTILYSYNYTDYLYVHTVIINQLHSLLITTLLVLNSSLWFQTWC